MWDKRYSTDDYVYGTEPNKFLKNNFNFIPKGEGLSLAEGEGRNAVFLAKQGYSVTAIDSSLAGIDRNKQDTHTFKDPIWPKFTPSVK
jgi:hypothetical protein